MLEIDTRRCRPLVRSDSCERRSAAAGETPSMNAGRVSKVTASDNVRLLYQQRRARCAVLEIEPNLDRAATPDSQ